MHWKDFGKKLLIGAGVVAVAGDKLAGLHILPPGIQNIVVAIAGLSGIAGGVYHPAPKAKPPKLTGVAGLVLVMMLGLYAPLYGQVAPQAPVIAPATSGSVTVLGVGGLAYDVLDQVSLFATQTLTTKAYRGIDPPFVVTATCTGVGPFTCTVPLSSLKLTTTPTAYALSVSNATGESVKTHVPYTLKLGRPLCRADVTSDVSPDSAVGAYATMSSTRAGLQALLNSLSKQGWSPLAPASDPQTLGAWLVVARCGGK